jgi:hypothetical protein
VVCANTLAAAGFAGHGKWSTSADIFIRHTSGAKMNIAEARKALGLVQKQITATKDAYQALVVPIADEQAAQFFAGVFEQPAGVPSTATDDEKRTYNEKLTRWNRHQDEIVKLYTTTGKGLEIPGVRGTAWAAYNAVTEWVDHVYPVLADGSVSQVRQQAVAFGSYSQAKERALVSALALAGGKEADAA